MATKATPEAINAIIDSNVILMKNQIAALDWSAPVVPPVIPPVIPPTGNPGGTVSKPISLSGVSGQTITGLTIVGGSSPCITLNNCHDMHVTLCRLSDSTSSNGGIWLNNCSNITVDFNFFKNVQGGVYATNCTGGLKIDNNQALNMMGKSVHRGQFCQFNACVGPNCSVSNNKIENIKGQSNPEDAINMYQSGGTSDSPIMIVGNWIRGSNGSTTGGGCMGGDSNVGSMGWQVIKNNILVNPGQYGIAISGGGNITLDGNQVFAVKDTFTNVGAYQWSQGGAKVSNPTVSNNRINYTAANGQPNGWWLGTGESAPAGLSTNNFNDAGITAAILPSQIITYQ